jgi:hypothetical protein
VEAIDGAALARDAIRSDTGRGRAPLRKVLASHGIAETIADRELTEAGAAFAARLRLDAALAPNADEDAELLPVVRPALWFASDAAGVSFPVRRVRRAGGTEQLEGAWRLAISHRDGRREVREIAGPIMDLADGRRVAFAHLPAPPEVGASSRWPASARAAWLADATPNPSAVLRALLGALGESLSFPPEVQSETLLVSALFIELTYVASLFQAVPYLALHGPRGSGKTTVLELLNALAFEPMFSVSLTPANLFRVLDATGGTLLYDEAETLKGPDPGRQEVVALLNAGYRQGARVQRQERNGDGSFVTRSYNCFGPKAIAGIASLPDALASRCIRISMLRDRQRRASVRSTDPRWPAIRGDLYGLALSFWSEIAAIRDTDESVGTLSGRQAELWLPLLCLARFHERHGIEDLYTKVRAFAERGAAEEEGMSEADEGLLHALRELIASGQRPSSGDILRRARELDADLFPEGEWRPERVAALLKRYGFKKAGRTGKQRPWSATAAQVDDVLSRYAAPSTATPPVSTPHDGCDGHDGHDGRPAGGGAHAR